MDEFKDSGFTDEPMSPVFSGGQLRAPLGEACCDEDEQCHGWHAGQQQRCVPAVSLKYTLVGVCTQPKRLQMSGK